MLAGLCTVFGPVCINISAFILCVSDSGLQCNKQFVADIEGNIRINKLLLCHGTDLETDISVASDPGNIVSTGPYHDSSGVRISRYCPPYQ